MNNIDMKYCLSMARSLDAQAARTRDDSYMRKLLEEQVAKYRAAAAGKWTAPLTSPLNTVYAALGLV